MDKNLSYPKTHWLLIILALLGLGVCGYLTYEHYSVLQNGFTGKSFCNINAYFNCDLVLSSRYATLGTIPLAGIGFIFYLYLLGVLLYGRVASENSSKILVLPAILVTLSCLVSLLLAYISFAKLGSFCLFCSSLYIINFLLLLGFAKIYRFNPKCLFSFWDLGLIVKSLMGLVVVSALGLFLLHHQSTQAQRKIDPAEVEKYSQFFFAQDTISFDTENRPFWGNPQAKITIVEFSDFECPFCKLAAFNLKPMLMDYKDQIKLVFINYPLDQSCNSSMPRQGHAHSCRLAYAAHCAAQQDKFWEYHDEAFDLQPKFSDKSYEDLAKKIGLNLGAFETCVQNQETQSFVVADIDQGQKAQITGTPTIYLNGRKLEYWYIPEVLKKIIEKSLSK